MSRRKPSPPRLTGARTDDLRRRHRHGLLEDHWLLLRGRGRGGVTASGAGLGILLRRLAAASLLRQPPPRRAPPPRLLLGVLQPDGVVLREYPPAARRNVDDAADDAHGELVAQLRGDALAEQAGVVGDEEGGDAEVLERTCGGGESARRRGGEVSAAR